MPIPAAVSASKAVAHAERYSGDLQVKQLKRLAASIQGAGKLQADWRAGHDAAGQPQVLGRIEGSLTLMCQRCLKPFDWPVTLDVELKLVDSEAEAARVLQDAEPYEVRDDTLPLREMAEDELLLALPLMPRCETCENAALSAPAEAPAATAGTKPFAALKKIKFPKS